MRYTADAIRDYINGTRELRRGAQNALAHLDLLRDRKARRAALARGGLVDAIRAFMEATAGHADRSEEVARDLLEALEARDDA